MTPSFLRYITRTEFCVLFCFVLNQTAFWFLKSFFGDCLIMESYFLIKMKLVSSLESCLSKADRNYMDCWQEEPILLTTAIPICKSKFAGYWLKTIGRRFDALITVDTLRGSTPCSVRELPAQNPCSLVQFCGVIALYLNLSILK